MAAYVVGSEEISMVIDMRSHISAPKLESSRCSPRIAASNSVSASTFTACSIPNVSMNLTMQFCLSIGEPRKSIACRERLRIEDVQEEGGDFSSGSSPQTQEAKPEETHPPVTLIPAPIVGARTLTLQSGEYLDLRSGESSTGPEF